MKKALIFLLFIIIIFILVSCAPGVEDNGDKNGNGNNDIDTVPIYDLSSINFNPEYHNPENSEEKGFLLFDYIDFNRMKFNRSLSRSPRYEVILNDNTEDIIEKSPNGTVFPNYTFYKTGEYEIKIHARFYDGNVTESFFFNVMAGGYPDKVELDVYDSNNNRVDEIEAGKSYELVANVYSDGELLSKDNELYYSYWSHMGEETSGQRVASATIGNYINDGEKSFYFRYVCLRGENTIKQYTSQLNLDVINNYDGLYFDYGAFVNDNNATFDVASPWSFFYNFSAEHKFENGDSEGINLNTGTSTIENTIVPFIKYNGDTEFRRYVSGAYDMSSQFVNYHNNSVSYKFNPLKDNAEMYLSLCVKEPTEISYRYVYEEIENSRISLDLIKNTPDAISITSIEGMQTKQGVSFSRDVTITSEKTGEAEVLAFQSGGYSEQNQNFSINIEVEGGTARDYYYIYQNETGVLQYNIHNKYFVAKEVGISHITVKSAIDEDIVFVLKVIIVNELTY